MQTDCSSQLAAVSAPLVWLQCSTSPAIARDIVVIEAHAHPVANAQSVAFSPDGRLVAAGFGGPSNGRFRLKPPGGRVVV